MNGRLFARGEGVFKYSITSDTYTSDILYNMLFPKLY